ncbi:MAG: hypothetical protein ACKOYL_11065 [Actinomycetota bacterium]
MENMPLIAARPPKPLPPSSKLALISPKNSRGTGGDGANVVVVRATVVVVRGAAVVTTTGGVEIRGPPAGAVIATVLTGTRFVMVVDTRAPGIVRGTVDATPGLKPPPLFPGRRLTSGTVVLVLLVVVVVEGVPTARWPLPPQA